MKKCLSIICISFCFQACVLRQTSEYENFRAAIPDNIALEDNKHIALILYNPEGCLPCNYVLTAILDDSSYLRLTGNNTFVVFPSVRASELQDYDCLFKTYGNVQVQYINDKKLFDLLRQKDKEKLGGKPKWLGLNLNTKTCFCFSLKEVYLLDSINRYFR